jgi:hypothetical protein
MLAETSDAAGCIMRLVALSPEPCRKTIVSHGKLRRTALGIKSLTITLAAAIVRHFALVELLVVTRRSRWVAYTCALELDTKLALAAKVI